MKRLLIILVVLLGTSIFVLEKQNIDDTTQQKWKYLARMTNAGSGW
ncbi:hypothetical protein [Bacillus paramycoides]